MAIHRWRWLLGIFIVLALAVPTLTIRQHDASGTAAWTWKNFGSGWARAGAESETPSVILRGTTPGTFSAVRFRVFSGRDGQRADVGWILTCRRGSSHGSRNGHQDNRVLPFTKQFTLPIANPDYCSLEVAAILNTRGIAQVRLQSWSP